MTKRKSGNTVKLLFIGNSFTQRNNVPGLLAELAAARGIQVDYQLISAGGASLRRHWNAGHAAAAIASRKFDYVVLQEQSTLPVKNPARMAENVRLFAEHCKLHGAKPVLYMTWARKNAPQSQQQITDAYESIGKQYGAMVIPVGRAWQAFLAKYTEPELYDRDGSHPTLAGSYLAACVFLAALFDEDPVGIKSELQGLAADEIAVLQKAARLKR
jgi:hypothetical protein